MIEHQINEKQFDFIGQRDKDFIIKFTHLMEELGYTYGDRICDGICWGRYMLIFTKSGVKSKKVVARIYIRDSYIVLRMYFNDVTKHAKYISAAPEYIKSVFMGGPADCRHCRGESCKFRKEYEIDGIKYEKCNGETFEFYRPEVENISDYIGLFTEFYPRKTVKCN